MTTLHYYYAPAIKEPQLIAAFPDARAARRAIADLGSMRVETDLIVTPPDGAVPPPAGLSEESGSNRTVTGAMLGAVWGMFMAALFINFLAVSPGIITVGGTTLFGALGGMALGGFIAGVGVDDGVAHSRLPLADDEAKAFITVHAYRVEDVEAAYGVLARRRALDIYRA